MYSQSRKKVGYGLDERALGVVASLVATLERSVCILGDTCQAALTHVAFDLVLQFLELTVLFGDDAIQSLDMTSELADFALVVLSI